ncbi:MAG TPA: hypothetical protein VGF74_11675 [Thermoleophilaceae bacterium]|jgi:hypothetical protein
MPSRDEVQTALSRFLLEKIRADKHPSTTQMNMLEQNIPPELTREYLNVLLEKVITDKTPSVPMLQRIQRIAATL